MGLDNPFHLVVLLVILLLVFGAKRLPEMGRSLGHGLRGFKESINGEAGGESVSALEPAHPLPVQNTADRVAEPVDARPAA